MRIYLIPDLRLGPELKVNAIKQKVTDIVERYLEVEQFLSIESGFSNPIADLEIKDKKDVEKAVNKLLKAWKIGFNALPNVIELLEDKEIKVIEIDAPDEFDGFQAGSMASIRLSSSTNITL